jgi:hypothetical protein
MSEQASFLVDLISTLLVAFGGAILFFGVVGCIVWGWRKITR